jgi:hypothetical protein
MPAVSLKAEPGATAPRAWFYDKKPKPARQESFDNFLIFQK